METTETFIKVYIKTESDLPKENGIYFAHLKDTTLNGEDIGCDTFTICNPVENNVKKYLLRLYDWYLMPVNEAQGKEIKSLDQIKNHVAELFGYVSWRVMRSRNEVLEGHYDKVAELYAKQFIFMPSHGEEKPKVIGHFEYDFEKKTEKYVSHVDQPKEQPEKHKVEIDRQVFEIEEQFLFYHSLRDLFVKRGSITNEDKWYLYKVVKGRSSDEQIKEGYIIDLNTCLEIPKFFSVSKMVVRGDVINETSNKEQPERFDHLINEASKSEIEAKDELCQCIGMRSYMRVPEGRRCLQCNKLIWEYEKVEELDQPDHIPEIGKMIETGKDYPKAEDIDWYPEKPEVSADIRNTELYKKFIAVLDINDMRADANPFVVKCCAIAEEYATLRAAQGKGKDVYLIHKDGNSTRLYKNGIKVSPEKFTQFYGCFKRDQSKMMIDMFLEAVDWYLQPSISPEGMKVTDKEIKDKMEDLLQNDFFIQGDTVREIMIKFTQWMCSKLTGK